MKNTFIAPANEKFQLNLLREEFRYEDIKEFGPNRIAG
jgi:hypothetical protein